MMMVVMVVMTVPVAMRPPMPVMAVAVMAMPVVTVPARTRAELIHRARRPIRKSGPDIRGCGLCGGHRRTDRESRREYDSNSLHFLLLFAGVMPA
jgi:hypothetical protein